VSLYDLKRINKLQAKPFKKLGIALNLPLTLKRYPSLRKQSQIKPRGLTEQKTVRGLGRCNETSRSSCSGRKKIATVGNDDTGFRLTDSHCGGRLKAILLLAT
jgi:hypothetical protein